MSFIYTFVFNYEICWFSVWKFHLSLSACKWKNNCHWHKAPSILVWLCWYIYVSIYMYIYITGCSWRGPHNPLCRDPRGPQTVSGGATYTYKNKLPKGEVYRQQHCTCTGARSHCPKWTACVCPSHGNSEPSTWGEMQQKPNSRKPQRLSVSVSGQEQKLWIILPAINHQGSATVLSMPCGLVTCLACDFDVYEKGSTT